MPKQYEYDLEDIDYKDEPNGIFDALWDLEEGCYACGYEGALVLKRKGYICPKCKELILPNS